MLPELLVWWDMLKLVNSDLYQGERLALLKRAKATENDSDVLVALHGKLHNELNKKRESERAVKQTR